MTLLENLQQKRIASPFASNTEAADRKIKTLADSTFSIIKNIDSQIKELKSHKGNEEDNKIRTNIITNLSGKLKDASLRYKKKHEAYLNKVKPSDLLGIENVEISLDGEEIEKLETNNYKTEEINSLVQNIIDLADIFKELNTLVVMQGTIFDRIDYNLQVALENTKNANQQLVKAQNHQKCTRAAGCIMLLIGIIMFLVLILGLKVFLAI